MNTPPITSTSRLERELQRERDERHRNDDAKSGAGVDDELRMKDARESASSADLHRNRGR